MVRYTLNDTNSWDSVTLTVTVNGNSGTDIQYYQNRTTDALNSNCPQVAGETTQFTLSDLLPGIQTFYTYWGSTWNIVLQLVMLKKFYVHSYVHVFKLNIVNFNFLACS